MDKKHLAKPWTNLQMRHYESVVAQDHRLQLIDSPFFEDSEKIVILNKRVANRRVESHPIAIYLNKSSFYSKQSAKVNRV